MPSHSVKQAKVMSAISHGWHPSSGSVAKIPVKVAKEFHAADAGHKYGKKHYTGGAIKAALNTVRKYHRKAEGGEVDDTPPDFNAQKRIYISPKIDHNEGLAEDLTKRSPIEGREPFGPSLTATPQTPKDTIANALRGPDTKSYEPRAVLANKAMTVLEATPPMQAMEAGQEAGKGNLKEAALGLMPAAKAAKPFSEALNYAANYAMQHDPQFGQFVFKKLKEQYPKDIATASIDSNLTPEQVANVKTYMSPGAQKAFEKHYAKMAPKQEPSFAPSLWNTPEIQATKPGLTVVPKVEPEHPDYIKQQVTHQGTNYDKLLADIEKELQPPKASEFEDFKMPDEFHQEPFQPHNEGEFHTEPLSGQKVFKPTGKNSELEDFNYGPEYNKKGEFKPTGKDSDIEDYYAHQEQHAKGPEWEPDPDDEYHQSPHTKLTPEDVKAAPYKQLMHGKITQPEYLQKFRESFRASDWSQFTPKDVAPEKVKRLDFGANKPEDLEKLGFNTKTPIFKGGNSYFGSGYPEQLKDPKFSKGSEQAFFTATHPGIASAYGPVGAPYIARAPKFYEFDWDKFFGSNHYGAGDMHQVIERARELGADVVAIHNMHDSGSHTHGLHTQLAFLNTHVLRAPTAAFNPAKLHLAYPLAGVAGGGIFTYGALRGEGDKDHMKRGGKVKEKDPEDHEFIDFKRGGLIDSAIPGRTDKIPMKVSPGSYVLPADIPSALGQGNTKAGSDVLSKMFTSGPYGLKPMTRKAGAPHFDRFRKFAAGGAADHVPIVAAGGEFIIHPDVVKMLGEGNMAEGHKLLDKFVLHTRAQHIKTLRKLKPPKP